MGKPSGIFALLLAVTNWNDGPAELRHLLLTLCALCNHETHKGIYGQEAIGRAMGKAPRTIRWLFEQLEKHPTAPIRVQRRYRSRADGRGRTSDEWTLELTGPTGNQLPLDSDDQPATHDRLDLQPIGNPLPLSDVTGPSDQPATGRRPTGNEKQTNRQPIARDRNVDRNVLSECDLPASADASPVKVPPKSTPRVKRTKPSPKVQQPQPTGTHELKLHYVADFERQRRETPQFGKQWSRAMKSLGDLVTTHGLDKAKAIVSRGIADKFRNPAPWRIAKDSVMYQGEQTPNAAQRKPAIRQSGTNPALELGESTFEAKVVPIRKVAGEK